LGHSWAVKIINFRSALLDPNSLVSIIFVPGFHFKMSELVPLLMMGDFLGMVLKWRSGLDHAAHFAGACLGICWANVGIDCWYNFQRYLAKVDKK
jgi:hypothetical protein